MASFVKVQPGDSEASDSNISDEGDIEEHSVSDDEVPNEDAPAVPSGLASVMAGILGKKKLPKKVVILAKGKTDKQIALKKRKEEEETEESKEAKKSKVESGESLPKITPESYKEKQLKKSQWIDLGRVKPSPLDTDTERKLQRIATRGVVQLFNAVRKQQKDIDEKLNEVGSSLRKREKVMKSVSKGAFLDMLKGAKTNVSVDPTEKEEMKEGANERLRADDESAPSWGILREDFMMGASMKDWDKASDNDSNSEHGNEDPDEDNLDSSDDET